MINDPNHGAIWQLPAKAGQRGFSLIEIALVLVIVGLVLGGGIAALGPMLDRKKDSDTEALIQQASDAILAYAMVNRRIPCPATATSNGLEVRVLAADGTQRGQCANPYNGFVPARTLGLVEQVADQTLWAGLVQDPWSYGLRYSVSQVIYLGNGNPPVSVNCQSPKPPCYPLTQVDGLKNAYYQSGVQAVVGSLPPGELVVCASSTGISTGITPPTCGTAALLAEAGFVVWSTARNGAKSLNPTPAGDGTDENANLNNDRVYVFHSRTDAGPPVPPNGAFDDLFQWQAIDAIIIKMIQAGALP